MKPNRIIIPFILLFLFVLSTFTYSQTEYVITTSTVKIGWNAPTTGPVPTYYEICVVRDDPTNTVYCFGQTVELSLTIQRPRSGKYVARIRSALVNADSTVTYSTWATSLDDNAMLKTGAIGKWKIYWKPSGPIGPILLQ